MWLMVWTLILFISVPLLTFPQNLLFSGPDMQYNNFHTFLGVPKYGSAKSWSGVFNIYKQTIALKIRKVPGKFHIPMLLQLTLDMYLMIELTPYFRKLNFHTTSQFLPNMGLRLVDLWAFILEAWLFDILSHNFKYFENKGSKMVNFGPIYCKNV